MSEHMGQDGEERSFGLPRSGSGSHDEVAVGIDKGWNRLLLRIAQSGPSLAPDPPLDTLIQQVEDLGVRA
jgi:hypothetical protein